MRIQWLEGDPVNVGEGPWPSSIGTLTAEDPLPPDLRDALAQINRRGAHEPEPSQVTRVTIVI